MIFTIKTPQGSEMELDSQVIESVGVEIEGKRYEISIKENS